MGIFSCLFLNFCPLPNCNPLCSFAFDTHLLIKHLCYSWQLLVHNILKSITNSNTAMAFPSYKAKCSKVWEQKIWAALRDPVSRPLLQHHSLGTNRSPAPRPAKKSVPVTPNVSQTAPCSRSLPSSPPSSDFWTLCVLVTPLQPFSGLSSHQEHSAEFSIKRMRPTPGPAIC